MVEANFDIFDEIASQLDTRHPTEPVPDRCAHLNTIKENGNMICYDCGTELLKIISYDKRNNSNYVELKNNRKLDDRGILPEIEHLGFSPAELAIATGIYDKVTKGKIYRGNSRKAIIFIALFQATKHSGKQGYTCENLREILGIDRKGILKGLKLVNMNIVKTEKLQTKYSTPIEFIEEYIKKSNKFQVCVACSLHFPIYGHSSEPFSTHCERCKTPDMVNLPDAHKERIVAIFDKIKAKSICIERAKPQSVSSSLVYYFLNTVSGGDLSIKDYSKQVKLSEHTVTKLFREITAKVNGT